MSLWNNHKIGMKRMSAGAMIFDPTGRILMVKVRIRGTWEFPAGRSEGSESPLQTCRREVREESGLDIVDYRFLGVNFQPGGSTKNGRLNFVFTAEVDAATVANVSPQALEISDYRWVEIAEARKIIAPKLASRFSHLLDAYQQDRSIYLEGGEIL